MNKLELKKLWNKLTDFTYIYGMEDEVIDIINGFISFPLKRDEYGNYHITIGNSKSLFVSHLDVTAKQKLKVTKLNQKKDGKHFIKTDGFTILGADDKTGVVIMLNMIDNKVPGTYYFLIGEEVGTIGSGLLWKEQGEYLSSFDRCIGFDRKGYGSIINRQKGEYCCSDEFVNSLSKQFSNNGMDYKSDATGVSSDSALFMGIIPECTNLSVGYFNEHKYTEEQDMDYMVQLCDTVTKIDWENLPTVREPKTFETEEPEEVEKEENHLPLYKLHNIFNDVFSLLYRRTKSTSSNRNWFKPNKEINFFQVNDLEGKNKFSVVVYWDGTIRINKDGETVLFPDFDKFKKRLKKVEFLKTMMEEVAKNKPKKLKPKIELTEKELLELLTKEGLITKFKMFNKKRKKI